MNKNGSNGSKPEMLGCNRRPGMIPGGFTTTFSGNSQDHSDRRESRPLDDHKQIKEAANAFLERRTPREDLS
jgi:hypothetical protein